MAERRQGVEQVEREPTFLEAVLHHLPAGILIVEAPSGRVMFHNELAVQILNGAKRLGGARLAPARELVASRSTSASSAPSPAAS